MPVFDVIEEAKKAKQLQEAAIREQKASEAKAERARQAKQERELKAMEGPARRQLASDRKVAAHHRAEEAKGRAFVAEHNRKAKARAGEGSS